MILQKPIKSNTVKILRNYKDTRRIFNFLLVLIFYKEVFKMEENEEVTLTQEMEEELSNGREENENE